MYCTLNWKGSRAIGAKYYGGALLQLPGTGPGQKCVNEIDDGDCAV